MQIKIIEIRFMDGDKPLRAFADVQLNGMIIREFRVIKENGKRPWIACPQISWKDPNGQIRYKTVVTLPDDLKGEIDFIILKRFTEEMERQKNAPQ